MKLKGESHIHFVKIDDTIKFIELRDKPILPMLRLLHQYPMFLPHMTCDKGAIKHIFSGSNVMAPGLTSEGGNLAPYCQIGDPVAIMAEGMKHAMAIGFMLQSSDEIKEKGKGMAIENIQFLNDSLWKDIY
uniref:PUA domain-containing protein n=1 Tax=Strombidium rassoulzadegani TaxID=1082188 RepID=A0A7S3CKV9_9SPIT|mmetsp:Transcript_14930/g.25425  ORF Transcript_14930/g.25425 Transcript_14930/m.25425 type:complete len:131 (+) Transcript_14930:157-549(+)